MIQNRRGLVDHAAVRQVWPEQVCEGRVRDRLVSRGRCGVLVTGDVGRVHQRNGMAEQLWVG
jgi:hypothetical protein